MVESRLLRRDVTGTHPVVRVVDEGLRADSKAEVGGASRKRHTARSDNIIAMKTVTDVRDNLLDFVRRDLVGPAHGPAEILEDQPSIRYSAGVLFPQEVNIDESGSIGGSDSDDVENVEPELDPIELKDKPATGSSGSEPGDTEYDDTVTLANEYKPSAIGLTFAVPREAREITISVYAAVYATESRPSADGQHQNTVWKRTPLTLDPQFLSLPDASIEHFTLDEGLKICLRASGRADRQIVTASLYNSTRVNSSDSRTFYQTVFPFVAPTQALNSWSTGICSKSKRWMMKSSRLK